MHLGWREQRLDGRDDGALRPSQHHGLTLLQGPVDQTDVDGRSEPGDDLDLQDGGLQLVREAKPLGQHLLRELDQEPHQVAHAVARVGRGGHHADVGLGVGVLVKEGGVETLLGHGRDHLLGPLLELQLGVLALGLDHVLHVLVAVGLPLVQPVDLKNCGKKARKLFNDRRSICKIVKKSGKIIIFLEKKLKAVDLQNCVKRAGENYNFGKKVTDGQFAKLLKERESF